MISLESFIARHGEPAAQAILENWERHIGVRHNVTTPLEQRWREFMNDNHQLAAA